VETGLQDCLGEGELAVPRILQQELNERVKDPILMEVAVVVALRGNRDERLRKVVVSR
jgi:hypothetical protein